MHAMHAMHALPAAATVPLTRHEMLGLVVPFARQKRQHDLPGSDRIGRRRVFKPVAVDARPRPGDGAQPDLGEGARPPTGLVETLQLDCHAGGASFCLSRVLAHPAGRRATLQASGPRPAALLAQGQSVAASQQLGCGPGWLIARNCAIDAINAVGAAHHSAAGPGLLTLRSGTLQLLNLPMTLTLDLMPLRGAAGDIALTSAPGVPLDLPEDLLAVLGWDWARLVAGPGRSIGPGPASGSGPGPGIGIGIGIGPGSGPGIGPGPRARRWTSKQRLRGGQRQRTRTAERALDRAARHLAQLLGEAPASFHTRHRLARWSVVLRRLIPALTALLLIGTAVLRPRLTDNRHPGLWMALHCVPVALLGLSFRLQELPRFEIPRWPRRPVAAQWGPPGRAAPTGEPRP